MPETNTTPSPDMAFSPGASIDLPTATGTLTIESSEDRLSFMSDFDITRDAKGLELAESIAKVMANAIAVLKLDLAAGTLPEILELIKPTQGKNPLL